MVAKLLKMSPRVTWESVPTKGNAIAGMIQDEMVGWHHRLNGREFEQTLEVGDGQGSLVCCSPQGFKESDTTELFHFHFL